LAHNVAASEDGPRGDATRSPQLSDDPENLILLCPTCHTLVDKPGWQQDYPEAMLAEWKRQHEAVIRVAGRHSQGRVAIALHYLGVIGRQVVAGSANTIPLAALQRGLVLTEKPFELRVDASGYAPQSPEYWRHVVTEVRKQVGQLQMQGQGRSAIGLFGLADMPALMALGFALGHAAELYPFQWDRYAHSWLFPANDAPASAFRLDWPETLDAPVALVLSLSGTIDFDRVRAAFPGATPAIIHMSVDLPKLDLVQCAATIDAFRIEIAQVIARLETLLPKTVSIHVFPAMPASLAVAFGMAIKPKVSFPIQVYDAEDRMACFIQRSPSPPLVRVGDTHVRRFDDFDLPHTPCFAARSGLGKTVAGDCGGRFGSGIRLRAHRKPLQRDQRDPDRTG
jgi:hypothetical protein